jgi:hypothetical protein
MLPVPLQVSPSVQPVVLSAALYINCTVDLKCLNTAKPVAQCSVTLQLNIHINNSEHLFMSRGKIRRFLITNNITFQ